MNRELLKEVLYLIESWQRGAYADEYFEIDGVIDAINAELANLTPNIEDASQDWAKLDGAVAWHLIERHAENWGDIGKMMDEYVAAKLAKPEQGVVPFPSFMRKRIEEAIDSAINPKGMSVHDGKATVYASDLQRMIAVIDLAPPRQELSKPEQEPEQEPVLYWHKKGEDDEKFIEPEAMNDFCPDCVPLYTTPPRKERVGLTDEEEIELDEKTWLDITAYLEARDAKLKEKNT